MTLTLTVTTSADRVHAPPARVLLVGPLPPPSGGMANQTRQLARLLEGEGCTVVLAQTNVAYRPGWIGRVRVLRALFRLLPYVASLWRAAGGVDVIHVMANSGWAWHLYAAPAVWVSALRGMPVVLNYRGGEAAAFLDRQFRWVRPTLARASLIVVPSGFLHEVFARHGVVTTIVPNIVNLDAFHPAASRPTTLHVLVTRNLEPIYDIGTALRAFALVVRHMGDARMTIAGSGPEQAALERLAGDLGIGRRVHFTGRLDNDRLPEFYRQASVVLNPSLADNMPISLLEALASGVPIVSTAVGGVPHLVRDDDSALLVAPGDAETMANALLKVAGDSALADRLARTGLQLVAQFAWPRVRDRLFDAYTAARAANPQ